MPRKIDVLQLEELIDAGAQVVDVLPEDEFEEQHIPGAINIPLKTLTGASAESLQEKSPVVVYCYDSQ